MRVSGLSFVLKGVGRRIVWHFLLQSFLPFIHRPQKSVNKVGQPPGILLVCDHPAESLPVAFVIDGHIMTLANTVPKPTRTTSRGDRLQIADNAKLSLAPELFR
jgi:hypothetical protein